ncbi:MAG: hypothetical protein AB1689_04480 [Thermodesulfobacteriota bacterium]
MTVDWLAFVNVTLYAMVASQHAFYALGMEAAQRSLGAPAYVELRNALDTVLQRSLPVLYGATLLVTLLSLAFGDARATAALALAGLVGDAWFMLKDDVPINERIRTWTPADYPADWSTYRSAWLAAFRKRQLAIAAGFLSLVLGVATR